MGETTYYQLNREIIIKEVLREEAKNKYRELSEEENNIKKNMEELEANKSK